MNNCSICPIECKINRNNNSGVCQTNNNIKIAKFYPHMFEEPIICDKNGSGTIFFCGCSLSCVFCQNYDVSRNLTGKVVSSSELVDIFKQLEDMNVCNINLVTPTHYTLQIAEALSKYKPSIPIVYNTHGYEKISTLEIIDKYIDIYLPDFKFFSNDLSKRYTRVNNYFEYASKAIEFMIESKREIVQDGMLKQGVIVRHMILPLASNDSIKLLEQFKKLNKYDDAYFSLMAQYTPFGKIDNYSELKRTITKREYQKVYEKLLDLNIQKYFVQELKSASESFIPHWDF